MSLIRGFAGLIARIAICLACIATLLTVTNLKDGLAGELPTIEQLTLMLENRGINEPRTVLIGSLIALGAGCLMLITGFLGRIGALLLLVVLAAATIKFFPFWEHDQTTTLFAEQLRSFLINAGLCASLLMLFVNKYAWISKPKSDYDDDFDPY